MRILQSILLLAVMAAPALADTEAHDALHTLQAKGYLRGYSDGSYHGQRNMSRDELSELLEHFDERRAGYDRRKAPESDYKALETLVERLSKSTEDLENRTDQVNKTEDHLHQEKPYGL